MGKRAKTKKDREKRSGKKIFNVIRRGVGEIGPKEWIRRKGHRMHTYDS